jgi:2-dehydropantoate 2-reductase
MGCVVHYNAALLEAAHALKFSPSAWRSYTVGELDGRQSDRAEAIASLLGAAGPSATTTDIFGVLWAKLAVNCMVNGLTAATGLSTPELWASPLGLDLMIRLAAEAAEVARAQGREMQPIHLIGTGREVSAALLLSDDPADAAEIRSLMQAEAAARLAVRTTGPAMATSMLQDMRKGRRPEIDYLNGYVVREGEAQGVSAPVNDAVVELVLAVSRGELRQDPGHLERVAHAVA